MITSRIGKCIDTALVARLNAEAKDWEAVCHVCHAKLSGTPEELRNHKHVDE